MTTYPIISADSHVIEPPDTWTDRVPAKYKTRAPIMERGPERDAWMCEGKLIIPVGGTAGAEESSDMLGELRAHGRFENSVPKGAYLPKEHIKDMAIDGVSAGVVYPTIALRLYTIEDLDLQAAVFDAYNRWAAEFCSADPVRLKAVGLLTLRGVEDKVQELRRIKELGLAGAMIAVLPEDELQYGQGVMDPVWRTAEELELPLSLHVATEKKPTANRSIAAAVADITFVQRMLAVMISYGVFQRFPKLKAVSAENDAGWAAHFIQRLDYIVQRRHSIYGFTYTSELKPSEHFHNNVWLTFMRDRAAIEVRHLIGVDRLMWSNDYPHHDTTWPKSQQELAAQMKGVSAKDRKLIVSENARGLYKFNGLTPLEAAA